MWPRLATPQPTAEEKNISRISNLFCQAINYTPLLWRQQANRTIIEHEKSLVNESQLSSEADVGSHLFNWFLCMQEQRILKKLKPADCHSENNEAIYLLKGGDSVYVNTQQQQF